LPILAWVIDHPEGVIVVDAGETALTADPSYFPRWHPYYHNSLRLDVKPEEEIGPQLRRLGIRPDDVKTLVLTHLHTDHIGGLHHFPNSNILASIGDFTLARSFKGRISGYLPNRIPRWFNPSMTPFEQQNVGLFPQSYRVTKAGDVIIVPTPGHTAGHLSVIVRNEDITYFLAGDTSYSQHSLLTKTPDGVSSNPKVAIKTMERIVSLAKSEPLVYLHSHEPESTRRLEERHTLI
jgi:glyoxylase-like metal-dependent hydrolase (beta-lactamase superfamily II)